MLKVKEVKKMLEEFEDDTFVFFEFADKQCNLKYIVHAHRANSDVEDAVIVLTR